VSKLHGFRFFEKLEKAPGIRPAREDGKQPPVKAETLEKVMVKINTIAIEEGYEDVERFRQDSTVIETNIHYPTNNSLVRDCIKESHRLLKQLHEEIGAMEFENYRKAAKKPYFLLVIV
jgi:IS5 family transposase